ncbi:hypothetical protein DSO57_1032662 [Entomophthora muscae]|uniref:Uncharacterized protein n=1 Tax=Entomophthora muscae TaxID=34485 RepID=A0ACC2S2Q3_9FUNG|nr:hypothetical protein DSO57_1032662 [Entomophthora muscae]
MAPSESSNLGEPITPNNAMEIDSANASNNNCNLNGPITPDDAMEINSPKVLINNCNFNEPIRPCNTMRTSAPNVLSNNCNLDEPIRSGAAGANYTHTILSQPIRYKKDPNWPNQFSSNSSEPMDTFHTPPEWFDPFWVAINQPKMDDAKCAPPKPGKKHCDTTQSDGPKERPGLSAVKILSQLMMTISLKDLCTESPKFCQKMHQAI